MCPGWGKNKYVSQMGIYLETNSPESIHSRVMGTLEYVSTFIHYNTEQKYSAVQFSTDGAVWSSMVQNYGTVRYSTVHVWYSSV